jgi:DNA-nicking Smr family endonuclease
MRRSRPLHDDERRLWDTVTRSIAPLRRRKAEAAEADAEGEAAPAETPPKRKAAVAAMPAVLSPPRAAPKPPPLAPLDKRTKQKLARGTKDIDARIDLHGMTQSEAHHALARFLTRAQRDDARVVLVITGKGKLIGDDHARERGVLKRAVPLWLESAELRPFVIGFEAAAHGHGGQGALYVRVRRGRA